MSNRTVFTLLLLLLSLCSARTAATASDSSDAAAGQQGRQAWDRGLPLTLQQSIADHADLLRYFDLTQPAVPPPPVAKAAASGNSQSHSQRESHLPRSPPQVQTDAQPHKAQTTNPPSQHHQHQPETLNSPLSPSSSQRPKAARSPEQLSWLRNNAAAAPAATSLAALYSNCSVLPSCNRPPYPGTLPTNLPGPVIDLLSRTALYFDSVFQKNTATGGVAVIVYDKQVWGGILSIRSFHLVPYT